MTIHEAPISTMSGVDVLRLPLLLDLRTTSHQQPSRGGCQKVMMNVLEHLLHQWQDASTHVALPHFQCLISKSTVLSVSVAGLQVLFAVEDHRLPALCNLDECVVAEIHCDILRCPNCNWACLLQISRKSLKDKLQDIPGIVAKKLMFPVIFPSNQSVEIHILLMFVNFSGQMWKCQIDQSTFSFFFLAKCLFFLVKQNQTTRSPGSI